MKNYSHIWWSCKNCQVVSVLSKGRKNILELICLFLGTEDDLEYYVRECGDILGVSSKLPASSRDARHILDYIFHQVVEFKKLNQVSI